MRRRRLERAGTGTGSARRLLALVLLVLLCLLAPRAAASAVLTVPYVAQSDNLCGGASLAMVMRHWGARRVYAEDFVSLVNASKGGIETSTLASAAAQRGFQVATFNGHVRDLANYVSRGLPVIVLLETSGVRFHYVVVTGTTGDRILFHDPAFGPSQSLDADRFDRRWAAGGRWAMLVEPPPVNVAGPAAAPVSAPPVLPDTMVRPGTAAETPCDDLVSTAVGDARDGRYADAERQLAAALDGCSGDARPLRELAGLRLLQRDWSAAHAIAAQAVARDPGDAHARDLLAASLYLDGDRSGALAAWNVLGSPAIDLVHVEGLTRVPYRVAAGAVALAPGAMLAEPQLRRARRRLTEVPAIEAATVTYTPSAGGVADVRASVVERPLFETSAIALARHGIRAAFDREIVAQLSNPLHLGEAWTARWRWWPDRPRVGLALAVPRPSGLPGIWTVEGQFDREAYADRGPSGEGIAREERRHGGIRVEEWWRPALRMAVRVGVDRWDDRGLAYSLGGGPELRLFDDRGALRVDGDWWLATPRFSQLAVDSRWRFSRAPLARHQAFVRVGRRLASEHAPSGLWPTAGATESRGVLLRAHPLLEHDVVAGDGFGRDIAYATIEGQRWYQAARGLRLGGAAFLDAARVRQRDRVPDAALLVDVGLGVRIGLAGSGAHVRLDAARSLTDGRVALSAAWVAPWPAW